MTATTESYDITSLDRAEVLRYLGYAGQPLTDELDGSIDAAMSRCLAVAHPRGVTRVFEVAGRCAGEDGVPRVELAGTALVLEGTAIARHLEGAVAVGVLAVTAGMGVDAELRRLSLTDRPAQLVFDAAGTTLVERAADVAEAGLVAQAAERGLFCNTRFSPGYEGFPLATQPVLLAALDAGRQLGITLSSSLLMSPTKSVTAVVGMFPEPPAGMRASCSGCPCLDFCVLRRAGSSCRARPARP